MRKKRTAATYRRVNPPRSLGDTVGLAASIDEARFVLTHVHTENGQRVATDGIRLHAESCKEQVCKVCESADPKEPKYPNYHEIVKLAHGDKMQIIKVDYTAFRAALVRCGLFSNPRDWKARTGYLSADHVPSMAVYIEHQADHICLWGRDSDIVSEKGKVLYYGLGTTRNVIEADLDSSTKRFDFSVRFDYMIDAIDHVGPGTIKIEQKNPNSPMMITGKRKGVFALVMPMAIPAKYDKPALLGEYNDDVKTGYVGKVYRTDSPSRLNAYCGKDSAFEVIQAKPTKNATEFIVGDEGIHVSRHVTDEGSPQGNIELVGQAQKLNTKPEPREGKPILSLMEQVVGLASGTIATLIDRTDYETIDKLHAEFIEFCQSPAAEGILTWSAAWEKFSDNRRFLERFSDDPSDPEPPAEPGDDFELKVKVEYDREWTWIYPDDDTNEYIRQAEDIRAAFKAVGGKFTNRRHVKGEGYKKAWYFMEKLDFETVENLLMGNIPVEIPETINA